MTRLTFPPNSDGTPHDPYHGLDRDARVPVRSNIDPKIHAFIFRQLAPIRGIESELIAVFFNKLYDRLLLDPRVPKRILPNGSIATWFDDAGTVIPILSEYINGLDFRLASSRAGGLADSEHDSGPTPLACGTSTDASDLSSDASSEPIKASDKSFHDLAKAIFEQ